MADRHGGAQVRGEALRLRLDLVGLAGRSAERRAEHDPRREARRARRAAFRESIPAAAPFAAPGCERWSISLTSTKCPAIVPWITRRSRR